MTCSQRASCLGLHTLLTIFDLEPLDHQIVALSVSQVILAEPSILRLLGYRQLEIGNRMRTLGNIIWFVLGGVFMGLLWWFFGILAFISIIGIPWGRACFVMGNFSFFPFGKEAISRDTLTNEMDIGTSPLGVIGNIIWFVFAGIWLAIGHVVSAVACFVTIIGIPFALQHLKLAVISLAPIGKTVVPKEQAAMARFNTHR